MRIEGRNPVREALRANVHVKRLLVASGVEERGAIEEILALAQQRHIEVRRVPRAELDESAETGANQGVVAEASDYVYRPWQDAVAVAEERGEAPLLLALDGITDPQNTGSLIRSAHMLGAHGVLLPSRRAATVNATVAKASAGAVFYTGVDLVTNLERALAECKKAGLWIVGLDGSGDTEVSNCPLLSEPMVLVVGAEGAGLSRLLRERADVLIRIPQRGSIDSFGASVAGAIALYAAAGARSLSAGGTQLSASHPDAKPT
ncbi:MAG TPA: 23S rRNA (guanosine(2251)-2'-O)-methyltransferase RlmB [Actinomycetota bacterium]|nr:23S rRNA (guanosine(2251)-2'-O)-methyltransferase RlmB [Actinomycetota bacterium]